MTAATTSPRSLRVVAGRLTLLLTTALVLTLLGVPTADAEVPRGTTMGVGVTMTSDNGQYSVRLQDDGNVVLADRSGRVVWHSYTYGAPGSGHRLVFQDDGNLVAYARDGRVLWHTDTWGEGETFLVTDDGRLVVTGAGSGTVWSSRTDDGNAWPWSSMEAFDDLTAGQSLVSDNGRYRLSMQADGNAVVYGPGGEVLWHSWTFGQPGNRLKLQVDGNLVVYTPDRRPAWHAGTWGSEYASVVMQDDGNLVVYSADGPALWSSMYGPAR